MGAHQPNCPGFAGSSHANAALRRYRDGYSVAGVIDGAGSLMKGVGIMLGAVAAGLAVWFGIQASFFYCLSCILVGLAVAMPLYVLGVLVSAQAQIITALLDNAVHTSPFLDEEAKASAMALD